MNHVLYEWGRFWPIPECKGRALCPVCDTSTGREIRRHYWTRPFWRLWLWLRTAAPTEANP
jgi:hypothetical protein